MANEYYISAGLVPIDNSTGATANSFYISAGLVPTDTAAAGGATPRRGQVILSLSSLGPVYFLAACFKNRTLDRREWLKLWRWLK